MSFILAAISLGFLGSFHCIGMCGPIALALPVHNKTRSEKLIAILTYNFGRILTYSVFGLVFGLIGQSFALFGYQQILSIILGSLILLGLLIPQRLINKSGILKNLYSVLNNLKNKIAAQFQKNGIRSFFSIGLLNGLLPCGLVYIAITGAVATGNIVNGMLFMAAFGFGTLPFMFAISFTSHLFGAKTRSSIRKAVPVVVGVMAILLILRGLNLGISYISPKISEDSSAVVNTCHKQINCCHKK
ncbi:MAG: sulfite exporter TauE/SafE family protein [Bacteroidota bacterium]|nr:sulfite exporter TauE/SafE family protein [Bacteroidota bacterium]